VIAALKHGAGKLPACAQLHALGTEPAAIAGCIAAAATTNSDAKTNFFIRPSDMQKAACAGSVFESGQTKAVCLMIYGAAAPQRGST
jgi:hypothetical protein